MARPVRRVARAIRYPLQAATRVSNMMRAKPERIFPILQDAFMDRLLGRAWRAPVPPMRFPERPPPPLGNAISNTFAQRDWTAMLGGLEVSPDGRLLDFGCGAADRRARAAGLGLGWWGLDVPGSKEASARTERDRLTLYGGVDIPFASGSFDVVLSVQVFEHVPDPHKTLTEIARILRSGGYLVGSTSFNEPFHSESTLGYSPAFFTRLLDAVGFDVLEITAGMDALTLAYRRLAAQFGQRKEADHVLTRFFRGEASPLNQIIDESAAFHDVDPARANALKLELSGRFNFLGRKRGP